MLISAMDRERSHPLKKKKKQASNFSRFVYSIFAINGIYPLKLFLLSFLYLQETQIKDPGKASKRQCE